MSVRTDLAIEAKRLWDDSMENKTKLSGVAARESSHRGIRMDVVEILDARGEKALGKPVGTYVTMELSAVHRGQRQSYRNGVEALARILRTMMGQCGSALVVGLGNDAVTPDAVGPACLRNLVVTRHLQERKITAFRDFGTVSAVAPGVLGTTGIESIELVRGAVRNVQPSAVIVVDALASCEPERLCNSVQVTDTGIVPGSGVGNHRAAFTRAELGVPVYAVGVPTVVDAPTFLTVQGSRGQPETRDFSAFGGMILTPRDIDARVSEIAALIGNGISMALHPQLEYDDIPCFLS